MQDSEVTDMKMLKRSISFFLILVIILAGCSFWTECGVRKVADQIQGRNRPVAMISAEPEKTIDVLVLGDSESYNSISPMQMWQEHGITTYVCGQGGQRIQEAYYMLKTALKTQSPKVVLLETNELFRNPGTFKNMQISLAEPLRYYMPVFRYHNLWKTAFDERKPENIDYKGFSIRDAVAAYQGKEYMKETKEAEIMSPFVQFHLELIRKLCDENGAQLLFVSAPSPTNYNYKKHNAVQEYADQYDIIYEDLNLKVEELGIDWNKDSQDRGDHLNVLGAEKFTKYLGQYLTENYDLEDHRGDENYTDWDRMAKQYNSELEVKKEKLNGKKGE